MEADGMDQVQRALGCGCVATLMLFGIALTVLVVFFAADLMR